MLIVDASPRALYDPRMSAYQTLMTIATSCGLDVGPEDMRAR